LNMEAIFAVKINRCSLSNFIIFETGAHSVSMRGVNEKWGAKGKGSKKNGGVCKALTGDMMFE
jgi:hypothetical protein